MTWKPFHFLIVAIAGWMNRQQQVIEYLRTENRILREKLGPRPSNPTVHFRRILAGRAMQTGGPSAIGPGRCLPG
jgi:hypothetical protein